MIYKRLAFGTMCFINVLGCIQPPEGKVIEEKLLQRHRLICQMDSLSVQTTALWDSVNAILQSQMPDSVPSQERNNLLAVRNADLISMFKIFSKMDLATQRMVQEAGSRDAQAARLSRTTMLNIEQINRWLDSTLVRISSNNPLLAQSIRSQMAKTCQESN
ncbi:MAG: hypothetical protein KDC57_21095 [Saprospiraceae bacterium]|nr:hypothetical protein [Saprospiraceae bacterium]